MKEKHKLIKRLLLEGKTLEEIRIEAYHKQLFIAIKK
jgi:hypothetical protein